MPQTSLTLNEIGASSRVPSMPVHAVQLKHLFGNVDPHDPQTPSPLLRKVYGTMGPSPPTMARKQGESIPLFQICIAYLPRTSSEA